jgi:putative endonuclease
MVKNKAQKFYFYVLCCADKTLYGGFTTDLDQRLAAHNSGKGAKYLRPVKRRPAKLIYFEEFAEKSAALKAEYAFKHQPRENKILYLQQHGVKI